MLINRLIYGLLLVLSLIFLNFYGGKMPYMLLFIMLILPVISIAYTLVLYAGFKFVQSVGGKYAIKGEKVNFAFKINNEGILFYPYVKVDFYGTEFFFTEQFQSESFSLLPRKKASFSYEVECKYRGVFPVGIKSVEFEDFLGIFRLRYNVKESKEIIVYPRVVYLDRFSLKTNFLSDAHSILNMQYEDLTTISDIRRYVYGDSMKRIHWKLSAKMDELYVKTFQSTSQSVATLFLDLKNTGSADENSILLEDKLIEAAVAVIRYCLYNWIPIDFVFYMNDIVNLGAKVPSDFERIYKVLAEVRFNQSVTVKDIIELFLTDSSKKTEIIIFTADINYDLYNQIYKTRINGYEVSIIYISPGKPSEATVSEADSILTFLPEIGVTVYRLDINDDIKLALES